MWTIDILAVAKWWKVSPSDVEQWSAIDFRDRQEFMFLHDEINAFDNGETAEKREWLGPDNDG